MDIGTSFGYLLEQGTKPDTLSVSLVDSPAGLCSWIIEKFHGWSYHDQGDEDGIPFTKDELLTNIMLYWINQNGASSIRIYKEVLSNINAIMSITSRIDVPVGLADFEKELVRTPKNWANYKFSNILTYNEFNRGGHFAALEEPLLLAKDIQSFVLYANKMDLA